MKNKSNKIFKTFYGEYSLHHWIEMILKNEITLPDFQRYFVWDPKKVIRLMKSFQDYLFVPPVLIANFSGDKSDKSANFILDGQQRLSAILLTYLGLFPNKFKKTNILSDKLKDNNNKERMIIDWDFRKIQTVFKENCDNDISKLKMFLKQDNLYLSIDENLIQKYNDTTLDDIELYKSLNIDEEFLKDRYLGYSFIKSVCPNPKAERKLFGEIFKNINTSSVKLSNSESRSALYWIAGDKKRFLAPDFINKISIKKSKIDFVRYLALLSNAEYLSNQNNCDINEIINDVAVGYARSKRFEDYLIKYVEAVVTDTSSQMFGDFSKMFPDYKSDIEALNKYLEELDCFRYFSTQIEADFYLFGLFYWVLFKKKSLQLKNSIHFDIRAAITDQRVLYNNKNLNRLGAIRDRMYWSVEIYKSYLKDN